ncbi:MAG: acyl--CoA ligase [Ignavibacteria bacterium]|nr:acyl--CoA ligase [Ignavibacteria bacterium]
MKTPNLDKWLFKYLIGNEEKIVFENAETQIKLKDLRELISGFCDFLLSKKIKENDRVAICAANSIEFAAMLFAIWETGAVPVLLNTRLLKEELIYQAEFSDCKIIISDRFTEKPFVPFPKIKKTVVPESEPGKFFPTKDAVIIFTSGSRNQPKAVVHSFRNMINSFKNTNSAVKFEPGDTFLVSLPFYHIGGLMIIIRAFLSGGKLAFPQSLKTDELIEGILKFRPNFISLVPAQMISVINKIKKTYSGLKMIFLGGGPSTPANLEMFIASNFPIAKVYGSSETCSMITLLQPDELKKHPLSSGKVLPGSEIKFTADGEFVVKSDALFKGYLGKSKRRSKSKNFFTGDYGYEDDEGFIYIQTRREDLIVTGGENVNPEEIAEILQSFYEIDEVFVFAENDEKWGQIICAAVSVKNKKADFEENIFKHLRSNLPDYKIPKKIYLFSKLPINEMGKLLLNDSEKRKALNIFNKL